MSGLVLGADLCAMIEPLVHGGQLDPDTYVRPGAWRGRKWPCTGEKPARGPDGEPFALIECTCPCHHGGPPHELPARANRTAVHPTDVLTDQRKFWGGGG